MSRNRFSPLLVLLVATMLLSACQLLPPGKETHPAFTSSPSPSGRAPSPAGPTAEPSPGQEAQPSLTPQPSPAQPTSPPPGRAGGWVDSIVMVEEPSATVALDRLESGELDLYATSVSGPRLLERIRESAELGYSRSYGMSSELTFNPAGPILTGTWQLNPFASDKVREAMNYLIDRDYIAREIYGGLAVPRFTCVNVTSADAVRMAGEIRAIELKYAYDPARAREMIDGQMTALGARLESGKWMYNGEPVTLIFLITTEDERRAIGDYVADRLESIGFTVDRRYKSQAEAAPIWQGDPNLGRWNIYTGGWTTDSIDRDQGSNFGFFYPPPYFYGYPIEGETFWPNVAEVAHKLETHDFYTLEERAQLFQQALELSLQDSTRVWLVDEITFTPHRSDIAVAADLSSPGGEDAGLWALTLRREGQEGGSLTVAQPGLLAGPWNGIAGSDHVYDAMPQRATAGDGALVDPYAGLPWPQRIAKADVQAVIGLPVFKTLDWLTLKTVDVNWVPEDAWVDWDSVSQRFITAGEKYTEPQMAWAKVTVYYPAGMYQSVKWHDGSSLSAADFVLHMILTFDRARPESAVYDASALADLESFRKDFKGVRIVSIDPLVIETYTDLSYLDAESMAAEASWWPQYGAGEQPWHVLAVGILAERDKQLAFSQAKAEELGVEWTNMIGGPSLDILKGYLERASAEGFVPYAPTLAQFLEPDEASARYANLAEWVRTKDHFWVGTGPYYLDSVSTAERTLVLKRFSEYPDPADKWLLFSEPRPAAAAGLPIALPGRPTPPPPASFDFAQDRPPPVPAGPGPAGNGRGRGAYHSPQR